MIDFRVFATAGLFLVACLVLIGSGQAGVLPGDSSLIATLDYSEEFTTGPSGGPYDVAWRDADFWYNPVEGYEFYYDIQDTYHGLPSVQWQRMNDFSFSTDLGMVLGRDPNYDLISAGHPGNPGAATGRAAFGSGEAGIDYGVVPGVSADHYVIQCDAYMLVNGATDDWTVEIGSYDDVGEQGMYWWTSYEKGLTVRFHRTGMIEFVRIDQDWTEHKIDTGLTTGLDPNDTGTWHNYAVEFNRNDDTVSVYVDEALKGTVNVTTFNGGTFSAYENLNVAIGVGDYRGWLDNFQVGTPDSASSPTPGDANEDGYVDVSDLGILATNYGVGSGKEWGDADFTGDGLVDVSDLGILATNYGTVPPPQAVPEPSTLAGLLALCLAGTMAASRRRRV